jgi:hypothetical protein
MVTAAEKKGPTHGMVVVRGRHYLGILAYNARRKLVVGYNVRSCNFGCGGST